MRVVIDTNVLISALFWGGRPRRVVDLAAAGLFQALKSPELLAEIEDVLIEDFGLPPQRLDLILRDILSYAELITPPPELDVDVRDPADVKVLACAVAGGADCIVTGDKDLLVLERISGCSPGHDVEILTVRAFLQRRPR
jgi:putative PIN family toxin of toxin-antitoxin system